MSRRDIHLRKSLGSLSGHIQNARVLLVGAGDIIDLDTIDLSNLNRQFLFRHEHIKQPKALIAKLVAQKFRPQAKLNAHHANIKDRQFSVEWFSSFNIVFNALDNLDARRHVNHMCLAANVPLIESGTTGFNGQVQVIKKGLTECYDCTSKPVPKSFPVCTIRSTPSQPIHCIVWAKSYLLPELFGTSEDDVEMDHSEDPENRGEIESLREEARALQEIRNSMDNPDFAKNVFEKVFTKDITRLQSCEDMWKSRKAPDPLSYESLQAEANECDPSSDQKVWNLSENFSVFKDSIERLKTRFRDLQRAAPDGPPPSLTFDKDDADTLDFVAASANLRSAIFSVELKSKFDIKQMAGNIIPAIATTNAMTAALCVLQAFKVMKKDYDNAKMIFLERSGVRAINTDSLKPPNPECPVCSVAQVKIFVTETATLHDLVEGILRLKLGYGEEFSISSPLGIIYDPDLEENLPKKLSHLGVEKDSFVTVIDEADDSPKVNLELLIAEGVIPETEMPLLLESMIEVPSKPKITVPEVPSATELASTNGATGKRKRGPDEAEPEDDQKRKLVKTNTSGDGEKPIILDDDEGGAILIDD
ncbi:E1 ubiquitin-activating protein uba2 [Ophidiomyces ophidiicola]|nr:E1 ubiquitin-activating protein uba2 [Ophidiomyces ophidiicola]